MTPDWNAIDRLLCVCLGPPVEVLLCTPALRALRAAAPARITLLTTPASAALGPCLPLVDAVLPYAAPWLAGGDGDCTAPGQQRADLAALARLAAQAFDAAVIFTRPGQSALPAALVCQLAGIPVRAGWCEGFSEQLLTHPVSAPAHARLACHPAQRQLDLVQRLGVAPDGDTLSFVAPAAAMAAVRAQLQAAGIEANTRWLAVHAGPGMRPARLAANDWRALLAQLQADAGCPVVLIHDAPGQGAASPGFALRAPLAQYCTRDVALLGALLSQASMLVGGDALANALAAAQRIPIVSLQLRDDPRQQPWRVAHCIVAPDAACQHCQRSICPEGQHDCLHRLAPARVSAAVRSLLTARTPI